MKPCPWASPGLLATRSTFGVHNNSVIDVTPQGGRKSVRLESHDTIDSGIVIADFEYLPANACGTWPALWLPHDDEHDSDFYSEIDIVESISCLTQNETTLHTNPTECTMAAQSGTGDVFSTNCDYDVGGCGMIAPHGTFGDSFNQNGGGVWATQVEAGGIKIWHFAKSAIPADIENDSPKPSKWGTPVMSFVPQNCDIRNTWKKMKIVINITFCGEYAGGEAWDDYTQCRAKTGVASCNDYVAKTPSAFDDVYFLINSIKTYNN
ncbi:glycoside hydrolase family 16 protein [Macroventuria anomochaeta]|uniref:Glycoside hydrolase family 16 protein n=1 Tax=Macroventuria anomochaeta TaxID=301207 RepID=A0ACB6SF55_9PLEO|nr:glycoside hydrolase family 16 protein [Macroventuria anomochaeta]KAF2632612.1 glycoside hydrolase family 16 protein [Macroventuria anomochaeta]